MEIISYLENTKPATRNIFRLDFPRRIPRNKRAAYLTVKRTSVKIEDWLTPAIRGIKDFLLHHYGVWLVLMLVISAFFLASSAVEYSRQFISAVPFAPLTVNENDFLNSAMNRFAFSQTVFSEQDEMFDTNGNLLEADGETLTSSTSEIAPVSFTLPVTYTTYTVGSNDTISGITRKFGLNNISTLIGINKINNVRLLRSGQKLTIPSIDGLQHVVTSGETLEGLSVKYQVTVEDLLDVNDLSEISLTIGQVLFIPGARMDSTALKQTLGDTFMNPLQGLAWRLTSSFGTRADPFTGVKSYHTGIDLAIASGTPVKAAMNGKIAVAGFNPTYGNYVIINHENGYQTLYAHLSRINVKSGQRVSQGGNIGLVGSTGYSTGPHLHFTVYKNGKLVNPLPLIK